MEHACVWCAGECGTYWTRAVIDSQDAHEAHWIGQCTLSEARKRERLDELAAAARADSRTKVRLVSGDLLDQDVEVIVNAWNRNIIPWWMLMLQGVSGAIKRRAGKQPFREIGRTGPLPLGHARLTSAGELPHRGIIHVATIDMLWRSSEAAIRDSAKSAMAIVNEHGFASVAFPLLGAGTGGLGDDGTLAVLEDALQQIPTAAEVRIVRFEG
ncbi:MAG: macro domain-containing protein [Proteobacteria bacterium]|nr:macro domain-containing protein [Pseudomonadota bacterium]